MDISVALATYNGARYLQAQLDSLVRQHHRPAELVVCDDRSSDATTEIVAEFARTAPFPVILRVNEERLHFADNFLRAASLCSADHVAFCDQDDIWLPHKLAAVARTISDTGACLVAHNATKVDATGSAVGRLAQTNGTARLSGADLHPWGFFYGFTCTVERRLLDLIPAESRPIDLIDPRHRLAHDRWVAFLASIYGDVVVLDEALVDYRCHGANTSGWMQRRRGTRAALNAAREKFGYHLLKHLTIARGMVRVLGDLTGDSVRLSRMPSAGRVLEMMGYWTRFEERCATRYAITHCDPRDQRLRRLGHAVLNHAYRSAVDGSVAYRTLAQDLLVSVVARPGQGAYAESLLAAEPVGAAA